MGTALKRKNSLPEGANSFLKQQFLMVYHIRLPPLNVTIFITHVRNCVMVVTPILCHPVYKITQEKPADQIQISVLIRNITLAQI